MCEPSREELTELIKWLSNNFGGEKSNPDWLNKSSNKVLKIPYTPVTSVHTFENDVTSTTPVQDSSLNDCSILGFTPINTFQGDIINMSPLDPDSKL